ncbi:MAG: hypothetical protein ACYTDU_05235 [Planctomycetota bacterium]|jgi:hypothetical protein
MRGLLIALLCALFCLSTGCSAVVAAIAPDHDTSVLLPGTPRGEIEREFGRPERTERTARGVEAVYRIRVGRKSTWADNVDAVTTTGFKVVQKVGTEAPFYATPLRSLAGAALAVPAMIGKDFLLAVREVASWRKRRRRVVVVYDERDRVLSYRLPKRP